MSPSEFSRWRARGGHLASAQALRAVIHEQRPGWTVRLLMAGATFAPSVRPYNACAAHSTAMIGAGAATNESA